MEKSEAANDALEQLAKFIRKHYLGAAGIVYAFSRKEASDVAAGLIKRGIRAAFYHAGQEVRVYRESASTVSLAWLVVAVPEVAWEKQRFRTSRNHVSGFVRIGCHSFYVDHLHMGRSDPDHDARGIRAIAGATARDRCGMDEVRIRDV